MATDWTPLPTPPTTWGVLIGQGNVVGPDTATDNAIARFDGETGKCIQNSGVIIDDSDNITGVTTLAATGLIASNTQLTAGVDDDTQGLIYAYGALTDDGGTVRLYTAGNSDNPIEYYGLRANEDDFEILAAATVKLTYKAEDEWQFSASVAMGNNDITGVNSITATSFTDGTATLTGGAWTGVTTIGTPTFITVAEDGGIGISDSTERIVFDGTSGIVQVADAILEIKDTVNGSRLRLNNAAAAYWDMRRDGSSGHYVISDDGLGDVVTVNQSTGALQMTGTYAFNCRDSALGMYSQSDENLTVFADGSVTLSTPITWLINESGNCTFRIEAEDQFDPIIEFYEDGRGTMGQILYDESAIDLIIRNSVVSASADLILATSNGSHTLTLTGAGITHTSGAVGICTTTVPHGGVGAAKLAIEGTNASTAGPHVQFTTATNDYPLLQMFNWAHDTVGFLFDSYFDGAYKSSDNSNFAILKGGLATDALSFAAESGIAAGSGVSWVTAFRISADAEVMMSPGAALKTYHRDANAWTYSPAADILEMSALGYVRIGAGTTSHSLSGHGDFLVSGLLEVNGIAHFDENLNMSKTGALVLSMTGTTYNRFSGNDGGAVTFEFGSQNGYDACNLLTGAAGGLQWIVGDTLWWNNDFDHAALAYPVMYFQSSQNPNVSNNEHGSWAHNGADFVCGTGVETGTGSAPTTIDNGIMFSPRGVEAGRFEGSGDFLVSTDKKWQFRDPEIYINSGDNGYLDLVADTGFRFNTGSVDIFSGVLTVGVSSVQSGYLVLAGHATGSAQGGQINLNTAYDYTGTVVFYTVAVNQADLVFGATGSPKLTYKGSEDRWDFATHLTLPDDVAAKFGTGQDADFFYGSDAMNIVTDIVAPSDLIIDCGTAKTMELAEPVFRDDNFGSARVTLGATAPSWDTFTDNLGADTEIDCLAFAVGDEVTWTTEIQHDYAQGEDFYLHVHYQCDAAPSGTDQVAFEFDYTIVRDGVTMPPVTNIGTDDCAVDTRYAQYRCDTIAISGTGIQIGDQLSIRMERVAAAGDAYAGVTKLKTAGTHYPVNTLGSRTVGVK